MRDSKTASGVWAKLGILTVGGLAVGLVGFSAGCSSATSDSSEATGSDEDALSRTDAIERADEWVRAKLKYCQSANHERDFDSACSATCERTDNSAWNPYRSDCSGLVSWAWGLRAPGRVTGELAPNKAGEDITHVIPGEAMAPGDALNSSDHIILFKQWVSPRRSAVFIEEPGCSSREPYAHEFTSEVSISGSSVFVEYEGKSFTSIRYNNVKGEGGGSTDSNPPPKPPTKCHSDTLGKDVSNNACVQSETNRLWYQCAGGAWVDRWTDPEACDGVHPL
ncbi:MAG: hypothetical protein ABI461_23085 [Polyangiaceae bacterium]